MIDLSQLSDKAYLGDGLYVGHDGERIWAYAHDGLTVTNAVAFEPEVLESFRAYVDRLRREPDPEETGEGALCEVCERYEDCLTVIGTMKVCPECRKDIIEASNG